jgi:hypothetical protein
MKLGGSLGNIPQICYKFDMFRTVSPFSRVQFLLFKLQNNLMSYCEYVPSSAITNIPFY